MMVTDHRRRERERGNVLLEFALISLVLTLLLSATVELGRATFSAQALQDVARAGARELSVTPLPPGTTFAAALPTVFGEQHLVIDVDRFATQADLDAHFAALPIMNQALRPLMIRERVTIGGTDYNLLRYPGALLTVSGNPLFGDAQINRGFTVGVPRVTYPGGTETLTWVAVVEEISPGSFPLAGTSGGIVGLRINYPFQAAAMTGHLENPAGPLEPNVGNVIDAEAGTTENATGRPGDLIAELDTKVGAYAGRYGLGRQLAQGKRVRPFRRLVSAQAIFRREVYQ